MTYLKPTFLCIGIQKAGTSWLYRMIEQHPEVCVSQPKELHFFNRHYDKGIGWYLSHFSRDKNSKAVGEFTPDYLWTRDKHISKPGLEATPDIPARVAKNFPDLKFIAILRNPVTRAISSYFHHIGANRISPNRRISKVGDQWGILSMGHYAKHLEKWFQHFSRDQFQIFIYEEDLTEDARMHTLRNVFEHLGVDLGFQPQKLEGKYNQRRLHFDYRLSRLPGRLQRMARQYVPNSIKNMRFWEIPISNEEMESLQAYYEPHNKNLEKLLGRDLPW